LASTFLGIKASYWIIILLIAGYMFYPPFQTMVNNGFAQLSGAQGQTPVTQPSGQPTPNNPTTPYQGIIHFSVTNIWEYDLTSLSLTNTVFTLYHHDLSTPTTASGTTTITATDVPQMNGDNGIFYLACKYLTQTVGWIDIQASLAANKPWLTGYMLRDIDNNGQTDIIFTVDVSGFPGLVAGQTSQLVPIVLQSWKYQTSATPAFTAVSSPTAMTTAGTYHTTGYVSGWTGEGYDLDLQRIVIGASNSGSTSVTANSTINALFVAGTLQLKSLRLSGVGAGVTYGSTWTAPNYDASNEEYWLYTASGVSNGASGTDVTQVNWGTQYVYQRQAGASWLSYDITWQTSSAALTGSSKYYVIIYATCGIPSGSSFNFYVVSTLTG